MTPGIYVYTSNRLEELLEALAVYLGRDPLPPLQTETIVVPGQGLARWVQQRLAAHQGIAAGLQLPFPGAFLQQLLQQQASGGPDLFAKDILAWRLWRLLADPALQNELGAAASYCTLDPDGRKRFQLCERLAACFDDYQLYRDDLLQRAAAGDDLKEAALGPHATWQARLWRALLRDAGQLAATSAPKRRGKHQGDTTPLLFPELAEPTTASAASAGAPAAHRLQRLRELLADPARARAALPSRLAVFGAGTLPPAFLELLQLAARTVPVALFVPQPTPEYVGDVRGRRDRIGNHPLLARLGDESREFADRLVDLGQQAGDLPVHHFELSTLVPRDPEQARQTALGCLQQDLAEALDRGRAGASPEHAARRLDRHDDSLRVHDCHSPQRELEVVRDQILAAFAADPALEPHDILVLVPDIDRYAPYAHAVFGPIRDQLPFHTADRSPVADLPLCATLFAVLQLAQERLHVFDVLHLLEEPAVQRRFGMFATDLPLLRNRCARAGIRWGLDGAWRQRHCRVPAFDDNAWLPGLDRLLLGVATGPEPDLVVGILPVADTTDGSGALLARFVQFAQTLFLHLQPLQRPHPLLEWADLLEALVTALFAPASADDEAAVTQLQRACSTLRQQAAAAKLAEPIAPIVLQDWLRTALQQSASSRGFLAGSVTVAAMLPMRTVPVQHLFLCGLDDQSFPRRDQPAPFDLLAKQRRPGDRSVRLDDRQMFLDALLAARGRLHITYVGHSQKDDSVCAPSVVLDELLDLCDRCFVAPAGYRSCREFLVVRHPLQPWSRRYRTGSDERLFTYGGFDLQRAAPAATDEVAWCTGPVTPPEELLAAELPFDRLQRFWNHPNRFYLQQTLRLRLRNDDDSDTDEEPFSVGNLDRWKLQAETVQRALAGRSPAPDRLALARASGLLPVGGHGTAAFVDVDDETQEFLHQLQGHGELGRRSLRATVGAYTLNGEIEGIGAREIVLPRIAKLKPKDRRRGWLVHLFAAVARHQGQSDLPQRTRVIGKDKTIVMAPLDPAEAELQLAFLLDGFRQGMHAPLPFFENSSFGYAEEFAERHDHDAACRAARKDWLPSSFGEFSRADSDDADVALCWRGREPLLLPAFAEWAKAVWLPLLACAKGPK